MFYRSREENRWAMTSGWLAWIFGGGRNRNTIISEFAFVDIRITST